MNKEDTKKDPKVFIVNRYPPFTSIYKWSVDLKRALPYESEQINIIFDKRGWEDDHPGTDFLSIFGSNPLTYAFKSVAFLKAKKYMMLSSKMKNTIVHYTNQFSGTLGIKEATEIVNVHDSPYFLESSSEIQKKYMNILYNSLKNIKYVITNTYVLKAELLSYGFTGKIVTIHSPYEPYFRKLDYSKEILRGHLGLPLSKRIVLSVSSDSPRKNLGIVDQVVQRLGNDYILVRVGKGLANSINFRNIDDETMNKLYNACDVLLFPSIYEGFGLPIAEAFASGLPVITSNLPTVREVAEGAAILVNPTDVEEIVRAVDLAINESGKFSSLGLKRAEEFTIDNFRRRIIDLYGSVLSELD